MSLKILHIAPFNTSGVPITFVRAERGLGHYSRLVTLGRDRRGYEEDVCLDLPFLDFWGTRVVKRLVSDPARLKVSNETATHSGVLRQWKSHGWAEKTMVDLREKLWSDRVQSFFNKINFWDFDIYQLDGGLEFYRDGRVVQELKRRGKTIICCYTGSDLRTRGVIAEIDAAADLNVTLEWDHLDLHPNIQHVLFPFETDRFELCAEPPADIIRIGHAPTNRHAKGSAFIIATVRELCAQYAAELVLIENMTYCESIKRKASCHIFIDQLGDLGYGLNSLEALAMGIPTCSCLTDRFQQAYPDHPFYAVSENNLKQVLTEIIAEMRLRPVPGNRGREWVKEHHDSRKVVAHVLELAGFASTSRDETPSADTGRPLDNVT